jgi:hypothetical protein
MFTAIGLFGPVTDGFMFVGLKPHGKRPPSQALAQMIFPQLMGIPACSRSRSRHPAWAAASAAPVQFVLQADTYDRSCQGRRAP